MNPLLEEATMETNAEALYARLRTQWPHAAFSVPWYDLPEPVKEALRWAGTVYAMQSAEIEGLKLQLSKTVDEPPS